MLKTSTQKLNSDWHYWPPEAKLRFLEKLRAKQSTELKLPELHQGQRAILELAKRFNVIVCGRRWGKTYLGIELCALAAEGWPIGWFSPYYKMLSESWREMRIMLQPAITGMNVQERRFELGSGSIEFWSLDAADSARGRKYKRVIVDEAAQVVDFRYAWENVITPMLTDYQGDAWWLSTPRGMNFFKQGYDYGQDPLKPDWASWQFPTSANPFMPGEEIELQRHQLPEATFKQEYLAEFLQSEGAVFRNIEPNLIAPISTPELHRGHRIVMGVDWAQKEDFTAICTFCDTCRAELELDRFNKIQWDFQRGRLKAAYQRWNVSEILAEENAIGSPNIEALVKERLSVTPFTTTAATKPPLIQSLALCFERNEAKWLPDPVAKAELVAYESKVSQATGRPSYSAPEGMHDDTVIARALAWQAVMTQKSWSSSRMRL